MKIRAPSFLALLAMAFLFASCGRGPNDRTLSAYLTAASLFDSGKFEEALASSASIARFPPAAILRGKAYFFLGKDAEAETALRSALRGQPSSAEARLALARVLRSRGDGGKALREVERALSDSPNDAGALRLAAELAVDKGDIGAARAFLDRAAEAGAETALVFLDRARLRWVSGQGEAALRDIQAAVAILPPESASHRAAAALEKAILGALR